MKLYTTYIETDKFDEVVDFYEKVFQIKGHVLTKNRWTEFDFGNKLSIYNRLFDEEKIKSQDDAFDNEYIKDFNIDRGEKKNNIVTFNFYTSNLKEEYDRIKKLGICNMSKIMCVHIKITEPYYYFNIFDPEGNTIEICSDSL